PLSSAFTTVRVLGTSRPSSGSSRGRNGRTPTSGVRRAPVLFEPRVTDRKKEVGHIAKPPGECGLRDNDKSIAPGAQTGRRGRRRPKGLPGGRIPPAI